MRWHKSHHETFLNIQENRYPLLKAKPLLRPRIARPRGIACARCLIECFTPPVSPLLAVTLYCSLGSGSSSTTDGGSAGFSKVWVLREWGMTRGGLRSADSNQAVTIMCGIVKAEMIRNAGASSPRVVSSLRHARPTSPAAQTALAGSITCAAQRAATLGWAASRHAR